MTDSWVRLCFHEEQQEQQEQQQEPQTKQKKLLHYIGSCNLVCELNIAQLEEIWSKNL